MVALRAVRIGEREIGEGLPCFVIAEAGVNHNGDPTVAEHLVDAAMEAGADAVKFQAFRAESLVTADARKAHYQERDKKSSSQLDMLRRLELSEGDFRYLLSYAEGKGLVFLASVFDEGSADMLDRIGVQVFKMGSGELTNLPLLAYVARKGKPMIISSGMSTEGEIAEALETVRGNGCHDVILLHCVSSYPVLSRDVNLRVMPILRERFSVPVGFSDHTLSLVIPSAAVSLGAVVVEKHLTLDREMQGPDHKASLEPGEFTRMVRNIREVEESLGDAVKRVSEAERDVKEVARRSVVAAVEIKAGAKITMEMLAVKRPGTGIEPSRIREIVGRKTKVEIGKDELLRWEQLSD